MTDLFNEWYIPHASGLLLRWRSRHPRVLLVPPAACHTHIEPTPHELIGSDGTLYRLPLNRRDEMGLSDEQ